MQWSFELQVNEWMTTLEYWLQTRKSSKTFNTNDCAVCTDCGKEIENGELNLIYKCIIVIRQMNLNLNTRTSSCECASSSEKNAFLNEPNTNGYKYFEQVLSAKETKTIVYVEYLPVSVRNFSSFFVYNMLLLLLLQLW